MHHSAGSSTLSFACLTKELDELIGKNVGVLAFDTQRHGEHSILLLCFELNRTPPRHEVYWYLRQPERPHYC